jgi:hypothetical protein
MSKTRVIPLPEQQPIVDLWPDAAEAIGVGRSSAYAMAGNGTFPVEVLRIGGLWKVRTADLRRYLRLDVADASRLDEKWAEFVAIRDAIAKGRAS